jgi:long-chain acyl-CoA synthetase
MLNRMAFGIAHIAAATLVAGSALAAEVAGVKLDDKASVGGQELVLNGAGVRSRAVFEVYVGSLYLPAKANTLAGVLAKGPRRVQLNLMRNLSADQLVGALVDGLKENTSEAEFEAIKPQTDQLVSIMKTFGDVKEGSVVTLDFVEGGTRIAQNGQAKGTVAGEPFNQALTRIWLGDKPVQGDLKKAMLGGG